MATIETAGPAAAVAPGRGAASPRRIRPPSQYWDHRTASWQSAGPIPVPRRGD